MDIGQALNDFWANYGGLIISIVSSGSFGTIIVAIVSAVVRGATRKINTATSLNITEDQMLAIASKFANYISTKTFNVDVSKLLSDEVTAQLSTLTTKIENEIAASTNGNIAIALIAMAMSKSKLLTEEEQQTLKDISDALSGTIKPKESIQVVVEAEEQTEEASKLTTF